MDWEVLFDEGFAAWLDGLDEDLRRALLAHVVLLREHGPNLGRPQVDTLKGSKVANLKELRIQHRGEPWRVLFAFDPARAAILLVGGNKAGGKKWYKKHIRIAEDRFERHLRRLKEEEKRGDTI
ncbi:MAG: type II toxin-antitoxin system RelE/ParE family toxin [Isosphaeraceae bacterium]